MIIVIGVVITIIIETLLDDVGLFIFLLHLLRAVKSGVNQRTSTPYFHSIHVNFLCTHYFSWCFVYVSLIIYMTIYTGFAAFGAFLVHYI